MRHFGTLTGDLNGVADWLVQCRISTVAMKATAQIAEQMYSLDDHAKGPISLSPKHGANAPDEPMHHELFEK
jgi:hypothetical protein